VQVLTEPAQGAIPYAVVGGRSDSRWWLIPVVNGPVIANSLAMFQPTLRSAKLIKGAAVHLARLGLGKLWARPRLYISGVPEVTRWFPEKPEFAAFFTGTSGPTRKLTVQAMGSDGRLLGYAKVTSDSRIGALLRHEASTLEKLSSLTCRSASFPNLRFFGPLTSCIALITDTRKTARFDTAVDLLPCHVAFLRELHELTRSSTGGNSACYAELLHERLCRHSDHLASREVENVMAAIERLRSTRTTMLPPSTTHGDFTPWNSFPHLQGLYAFDWEYAEFNLPATNDLIHFLLSPVRLSRENVSNISYKITKKLSHVYKDAQDTSAPSSLLIYGASSILHYAALSARFNVPVASWPRFRESSFLLEFLVTSSR
jgi:hypothetical protein